MASEQEAAVVGGGVIGLSIAWELARRGWQVRVLDRGAFGREASWAGAGMLPAAPAVTSDALEQLMAMSRRLHADWAAQLREETGIDNGFQVNGALYVARTPVQRAALRAWRRDCIEQELACEWLEPGQLRDCEPALHDERICGACRLPEEAQLRNPRHLQALQQACRQRGVKLASDCEVEEIDLRTGRLRCSAGTLSPARTVVAAGPWTRRLLEGHGWTPDIYPVRGQMVLYRCPQRMLQHTIIDGPRYLVPRDDGRLLAGSTEEEVGFDQRTTAEAVAALQRFACGLAPGLDSCEVEQVWAGLRPAAFDGFPYLGRVPNTERVYVASGHFRHGLNLSTGTAVLMAQLLCDEPTSISLERFHVGR